VRQSLIDAIQIAQRRSKRGLWATPGPGIPRASRYVKPIKTDFSLRLNVGVIVADPFDQRMISDELVEGPAQALLCHRLQITGAASTIIVHLTTLDDARFDGDGAKSPVSNEVLKHPIAKLQSLRAPMKSFA